MNWTEIKEKYPKSEALIDKCIRTDRDLYDFFDEQGICIGLCVTMHQLKDKTQYYADFCIDNFLAFETENQDTRTEAEEKAFEKAFEILENKLPIK